MGAKLTRESESMEAEFVRVHKRLKTLVLNSGCTDQIIGVKRTRESESIEAEFDHVHKRLKPDDTDQISQLPDDILFQILSFVPQETETVGKTLFVSKRWLNLWTTLPFLCFKFRPDCNSETNTGIMNFIQKVFSFRDKSTSIEKFCLSSSKPNNFLDAARVNDLIREVVLRHGVRELDLKLENNRVQFISPFHVSCSSLTSLKLLFDTSSEPNFPVSFSFPNLKTMELKHVILGSNIASELSNNCHKLESLSIRQCAFVWIDPNNNCSNLRTLPNLFKASLSIALFYECCAFDFLPVISNVEVLFLKIDLSDLFLDELEKVDYFSKFHNLKSLEFGRFEIWETNVLERLLRSSPALEYLSIDFFRYYGAPEDIIPRCRLSERLKVIKMEGVSPVTHLIKLVKYFLEEAKGLEKMTVCKPFSFCCKQVQRDDICQKLQALPNSGALELCEDDTCGLGLNVA